MCWCLRSESNQQTSGFSDRRSDHTYELRRRKKLELSITRSVEHYLWGERRDSNSRSSEPQSDVLGQLHYSHHIRRFSFGSRNLAALWLTSNPVHALTPSLIAAEQRSSSAVLCQSTLAGESHAGSELFHRRGARFGGNSWIRTNDI